MWLRLISTNLRTVVFSVLIMSVSFKVTEMIRFPNAVHTAAWYPWILYALTRILLSKLLKDAVVGGVLATVYTCILCIQIYFYHNNIHDRLWTIYFKHVSEHTTQFLVYGGAAFVVIFSLLLFSKWIGFKSNRGLTAVLAILVLVATLEMRHVGARVWTYQGQTGKGRIHLNVAKLNEASFGSGRTDRRDSIALGANFSVGVLPNWYFGRYNEFLKETEDELEVRRTLLGIRDGRKIFFSGTKSILPFKHFFAIRLATRIGASWSPIPMMSLGGKSTHRTRAT